MVKKAPRTTITQAYQANSKANTRKNGLPKKTKTLFTYAKENFTHQILHSLEAAGEKPLLYSASDPPSDHQTTTVYTGKSTLRAIQKAALGLKAQGVRPNDHVGIMGAFSVHTWIFSQAIMSIAAVAVIIPHDIDFDSLLQIPKNSKLKIIFTEDEACCDILTALQKSFRLVILRADLHKKVTQQKNFPSTKTISWASFLAQVPMRTDKEIKKFQKELSALQTSTTTMVFYTQVPDQQHRGIPLTGEKLFFQVTQIGKLHTLDPSQDRVLITEPLSRLFEYIHSCMFIQKNIPVILLGKKRSLSKVLQTFHPSLMLATPTTITTLYHDCLENIKAPQNFSNTITQLLFPNTTERSTKNPIYRTIQEHWFKYVTSKKITVLLGERLQAIITSEYKIENQVTTFFQALNIPLYLNYTLPEAGSIVAYSCEKYFREESAGKVLDQVKIKISKTQEILVHSPSLMPGYLPPSEPQQDILKKQRDGTIWLATGDRGILKKGYLYILEKGHLHGLLRSSSGHLFDPLQIENHLCKHPLIHSASIFESLEHGMCTLIFINQSFFHEDRDTKINFAEQQIHEWIKQANQSLRSWEIIKKFKITWQEIDEKNDRLALARAFNQSQLKKKSQNESRDLYLDV